MAETPIRRLPFGRPASDSDLFSQLAQLVNEAIVERIARADGPYESALVRWLLAGILGDNKLAPGKPEWTLQECSALMSNHTWHDMNREDHLTRLFAASTYLACHTRLFGMICPHAGTMARMVRSATVVGAQAVEGTSAFVAWLAEADDCGWPRSFHALAVLLLEAFLDPAAISAVDCAELERIVDLEETRFADEIALMDHRGEFPWLLCLDFEQQQFCEWGRTAGAALAEVAESHPLRQLVERFGGLADPSEVDEPRFE